MSIPDVETLRLCSLLNASAFGGIYFMLWLGRRTETHLLYWAGSSILYYLTLLGLGWFGHAGLGWGAVLFASLAISNLLPIMGLRRFEDRPWLESWMVLPPLFAASCHVITVLLVEHDVIAARFADAGNAIGLGAAMLTSGLVMVRGPARGQRIAGFSMLCYVPGFAIVALAPIEGRYAVDLALVPMLSDQVLLAMLNLGLLAIPFDSAQARLRDAAMRDPLTGAWNRSGLAEQAVRLWRTGAGVIAIDVDNFKAVNDRFGHAEGDRVLAEIARTAAQIADEEGGALARVGGDEFVLVMPADGPALHRAAERLMTRLGPADRSAIWSLSLGLASVASQEPDFEAALRRADAALYQAKAGGRNRLAA